jgi:hypothetical protein
MLLHDRPAGARRLRASGDAPCRRPGLCRSVARNAIRPSARACRARANPARSRTGGIGAERPPPALNRPEPAITGSRRDPMARRGEAASRTGRHVPAGAAIDRAGAAVGCRRAAGPRALESTAAPCGAPALPGLAASAGMAAPSGPAFPRCDIVQPCETGIGRTRGRILRMCVRPERDAHADLSRRRSSIPAGARNRCVEIQPPLRRTDAARAAIGICRQA